jgi:hypothetical protein
MAGMYRQRRYFSTGPIHKNKIISCDFLGENIALIADHVAIL